MKARVLRVLDQHDEVYRRIQLDGDGKKVLANNGLYVSIGSGLDVSLQVISSNNQQVNIQSETGKLYIIDTNNYSGTNVLLHVSSETCDMIVKNGGRNHPLTFVTNLDGTSNLDLGPLCAVRLVFYENKWYII